MTGRDVWAAWAADVRDPSDPPDAPGLTDLEAAVRDLPDAELEAGLRRGLLWARMGLGECAIWAPHLPYNANALAHELSTRQWSTVMGACYGALAVVRRPGRPGPLRDHVRLPDRTEQIPAPQKFGSWSTDLHHPRCPLCGVHVAWHVVDNTRPADRMPIRLQCQDGHEVGRRAPGHGPPCPWGGASGTIDQRTGRITIGASGARFPRSLATTLPPEAKPFSLDDEVLP